MPGIPDTVTMKLDHDVVKLLAEKARGMGLSVEAYMVYVLDCEARGIDRRRFDPTMRHLFVTHGELFRRLADHDYGPRSSDDLPGAPSSS